ncbi:MAG: hypothetical protein ACR2J8_03575, partial [Thermomicrobiales bacterium]
MDQSSFDRIARLLGGATTRRSGLQAALGAAFGLGVAGADAKSGGKSRDKHRGGNRRPAVEGPCGNGSRKDNICTRDKDCCTDICNVKAGKKNIDGKGRCRCHRRGKACKADKNCCNTLTCVNGVCGGGGGGSNIPTSFPCVAGVDICEDSKATCTAYDDGSDGPAGTYCLLPFLATACAKSADCGCNSCYAGACLTCGCGGCPADDACAAPTVTTGTIQAAVDAALDGDTITIASGTY